MSDTSRSGGADAATESVVVGGRRFFRNKPLRRSTVGRIMVTIGILGIVVSLIGMVVGRMLISQVHDSVDDSLLLTQDALTSIADTVALTGEIIVDVQAGLETTQDALSTAQQSFDQGVAALDSVEAFAGDSLPKTLEAVSAVLPTVEGIAGSIDNALRAISRAPFGPDYDPAVPFDDAIGQLDDAIAPLPDQLRTLAGDLGEITKGSAALSAEVADLVAELGSLNDRLDEAVPLLIEYAVTTDEARVLAERSRNDLDSSTTLAGWLIVVLAIVFAAGQLAPIWLGLELLRESDAGTPFTASGPDPDADPEPAL